MKKLSIIFLLLLASHSLWAQMINPYVDDKPFHFGFSLGVNFMAYGVTESGQIIDGERYHARASSMLPGFSVGFVSDLRLTRHLDLRFLPNLNFGQRSITYTNESGHEIGGSQGDEAVTISLPLNLPIVLKWSAEREMNYRPYLIAGGGVGFDFAGQKKLPIFQKMFDYFVTFGVGCDIYREWFKFCPEISYQCGFNNVITKPVESRSEIQGGTQDYFYTNAISRLRNQQITLTFNFE